MTHSSIAIAIVDHHDIVREGLASILGRTPGFVVTVQGSSIADAVEPIVSNRPEVLIAAAVLPDGTGIALGEALRERGCSTKMVLLVDGDRIAATPRSAGIHAHFSKADGPEVLIGTIRAVIDGGMPATLATGEDPGPRLPPYLLRVLASLAKGHSTNDIAEALGLSVHTAKTYLRELYAALGTHNRSQTVADGIRRGLV